MESADEQGNPYAAPATVAETIVDTLPRVLAGRAERLGAVIVDNLMVGSLLLPGYMLLLEPTPPWVRWLVPLAWVTTPLAVALIGSNIFLLVRDGQTLAKRWFGVRVVRADGTRCAAARLLGLRYVLPTLIGALPCIGPLFSLVDALTIFRDERRCLHDEMADTIVVRA